MSPGDWPAVERIYAAGIATGNATFETGRPAWADFDASKLVEHRLVAEADGRVVGWVAACAMERIEQRKALAEERANGTLWQRRDSGCRAKQPTHVDVDPAAWRRAKAAAAKNGMTIGLYVGSLVRLAVEQDLPAVDSYASTAHVFARVDVDKLTWDTFKGRCHNGCFSVARGVGGLVEAATHSPS